MRDVEQREALAKQALAIPLATYRYKTEASTAKRRLGFIIDDHAPMFDDDPPDDVGFAYHGHGHATGYLQGLLAAVMTERA